MFMISKETGEGGVMNRLICLALVVVVLSAGCAGQPSLQIGTNSLPSAVVQQTYSAKLIAIGGIPPFRWSSVSGQLPSGMTLSADTGQVFGTPLHLGSFESTVNLSDSSGPQPRAASQRPRLKVNPKLNQTSLVISTTTLPSGTVQAPYTRHIGCDRGHPALQLECGVPR